MVIPTDINENPNIKIANLPTGSTFIAVGAVFGLIVLGIILAWMITFCVSSKRAKDAKMTTANNDYYEYDPSVFNHKKNYSQSVYSLGSTSTLNVLGSQTSLENTGTKGGRTYRNALARASRSSLFISPTEMLSLPMMIGSAGPVQNSYYDSESPIESPSTAYFDQVSNNIPKEKKQQRPPSVYMEKLFDDCLSDSSSDRFDFTDEKV